MTKFDDFLKEQLLDPEIKREWNALESEFEYVQTVTDAEKNAILANDRNK